MFERIYDLEKDFIPRGETLSTELWCDKFNEGSLLTAVKAILTDLVAIIQ